MLTASLHIVTISSCAGSRPTRAEFVSTVLQWLGAAGVLCAFALSQREAWPISSRRYLITNLLAGLCLCAAAILTRQWGYTLLEGAWAVIAFRGLILGLRGIR